MSKGYGARTQNYEEYMKDHERYERTKVLKGRRKTPKQMAEEIKRKNKIGKENIEKGKIFPDSWINKANLKDSKQETIERYKKKKALGMGLKDLGKEKFNDNVKRGIFEDKKYSTETEEQLKKAKTLRDINTGVIYDKLSGGTQYKSRKDGYAYYIDTNVANRDNPQYETVKDDYINDIKNAKSFAEIRNITNKIADKETREQRQSRLFNLQAYGYHRPENLEYAKEFITNDYNRLKNGEYKNLKSNFEYKEEKPHFTIREATEQEIKELGSPRDEVSYYLSKGEFDKAFNLITDYDLLEETEMFLQGMKTSGGRKEFTKYLREIGYYDMLK